MSRFPPLKALRAFQVAAVHLNLTRAADELCVTPAAVSYQIKLLENDLGTQLFERHARSISLTKEGLALLCATKRAFQEISSTIDAIKASSRTRTVTVSCLPHFSAKVLMPGRPAFQQQHPGIELAIQHSLAPPDLDQSGIQFGIRFGLGKWPGLVCDLLLQSDVAPACAGQLLNDGCRLLSPADLAKVTILLDDDSFHELWVNWFEINGLIGWESLKFTKCDDVHVLLEAATDGHAVVLEPEFLISNLLKSGRLVHPFDYSPVKAGYYLTYTANALDASECRLFRDWILTHMDGQRHMA